MIIECPHCSAFVDGKVLGEKEWSADDYGDPRKVVLLECPTCDSALLGFTEIAQTADGEWDWYRPTRLWPKPTEPLPHIIPREARKALKDAKKCLDCGVNSAAAVMAGRAIEAMCKEKVGAKTLAKGLEKMKDQGLIDEKIWNWGDALRKERNLGAHASGTEVSKEDAEDILDFATAIFEYVYVLAAKYDDYMERKGAT
jgi:HEPN domain-containing protein